MTKINRKAKPQGAFQHVRSRSHLSLVRGSRGAERAIDYPDAKIIGDLSSPAAQAVLASSITVLKAPSCKTPGNRWEKVTGTVEQLLDSVLGQHPKAEQKDGLALTFADAANGGRHTDHKGKTIQYGQRLKSKIATVTALAIDVDGTAKIGPVKDRLAELGLFSVLYTTHSHAAKKTVDGDRFRVIIFLDAPFILPANQEERRAAVAEWESRYVGFCELLGLADMDASALSANQMMYAPRRPKGTDYEHYIIAGAALQVADMPCGDASAYKKAAPLNTGQGSTKAGYGPAVLSDGFEVRDWFNDGGKHLLLEDLLDLVGWEDRGTAGAGRTILCPNDAAHTNAGDGGDSGTWSCEGDDGFVVTCRHAHCSHLNTWDMIRMIEANILEGHAVLPDGHATLSSLLCDPMLYPEIEGEDLNFHPCDYGVEEKILIEYLGTPKKVEAAFKAVAANNRAGDDHFASLYAGVEKAGNKGAAVKALDDLIKSHGLHDPNKRKALGKRGREMLKADKAAYAADKAEAERETVLASMDREDLAHPSLDPSDPLGDTVQAAQATLHKRYAVVDLGGKFRVVRKPDLEAFTSDFDSTVVVYHKQDFLDLHLDRKIKVGDDLVNPAQIYLDTAKRKSGMVFAPPPLVIGANDYNMYQGRKLVGVKGVWPTLKSFIFKIICKGDQAKYDWLMLWMAHMVQFPGEKPGTAVICRGEGGTGKGTFGAVLAKLAAPHVKTLEKEGHVVGQFSGEHLSICILAIVTEAVFGKNPKVASELKAMVDGATMQVEAKGMNVITVPSYLRMYFDSNDALPILIEGNGSERRYFVIETANTYQRDLEYFMTLRAAINGDEMAGLLHYLERYDPASAGLSWDDVRDAPQTAERDVMALHSMSGPLRRLQDILKDGQVTLWIDGSAETYVADDDGLKVPLAPFRSHIADAGNKRRAEDADVPGMFKRLHPGVMLEEKQGAVGAYSNVRWWRFPASVIGGGV